MAELPTYPALIYNAEFTDFYVDVCGSFDNGELIAWDHGGPGVNQVWTFVKQGSESGSGYHFLSTVLKDQNGGWLQRPTTVYATANNPDAKGPHIGGTVRASSTASATPLTFYPFHVQESGAYRIFALRGEKDLFLTLESGAGGTKLKLDEKSDQLRQLWKFKPAESGLRLGPGQGTT